MNFHCLGVSNGIGGVRPVWRSTHSARWKLTNKFGHCQMVTSWFCFVFCFFLICWAASNGFSGGMRYFPPFSPPFPLRALEMGEKICHFKLMSFFKLDEMESNESSVKMQNVSTFFTLFPIKMAKWIKKICHLTLVSFFRIKWNWIEWN